MDKDLNFRHVIKTIVPGLFTTISLLFIFDLLATKFITPDAHREIFQFIEKNNSLAVGLLIPLSLFVGITINTICFVYFIPFIVEHHKKCEIIKLKKGKKRKDNFNYSEFQTYKENVINFMNDYYYNHLFPQDIAIDANLFKKFFEVDYFLQHRKNITNLQYIKTGYWYYLEFQLNAIISIIVCLFALYLNLFYRTIKAIDIGNKYLILISSLITGGLICRLMYKAIIRNLERDQKKELSYVLGAFHICRSGKNPI